jgi:hypothetical protein
LRAGSNQHQHKTSSCGRSTIAAALASVLLLNISGEAAINAEGPMIAPVHVVSLPPVQHKLTRSRQRDHASRVSRKCMCTRPPVRAEASVIAASIASVQAYCKSNLGPAAAAATSSTSAMNSRGDNDGGSRRRSICARASVEAAPAPAWDGP